MEDWTHMLVLGNDLINLGNLDLVIVKEAIDAHVAARGRPMPNWPEASEVIVISFDSEEEGVEQGGSTDTATVSVVKARASVPTFEGPEQSLMCPTVQPTTAVSTSMLSSRNLIPVPTQHSTPRLATPVASTGFEGPLFHLTLPNVSLDPTQPQAAPLVTDSVEPTAAVPGQMQV